MSKKTSKINREIENKRSHLKQLSSKRKARRVYRQTQPNLDRPLPTRKEKESFLIICEGENTEPDYFNHFKLKSAKIKAIGEGFNTLSLINRAVKIVNDEKEKGLQYDQVWCVFDKDSFSDNDFNSAIKKAEDKHNFKVAYSNQAFEYWLILHFNDHQGGAIDRKSYNKLLNSYLKQFGIEYDGSGCKKIDERFFEILEAKENLTDKKNRQQKALDRAEKIYNKLDHKNPAQEESSTKVFLLVTEILKNI